MPIKVNEDKRKELINSEVDRALKECQSAADKGLNSIYFTTKKDVNRDVRNVLRREHKVIVPMLVFCGASPSKLQIEHHREETTMKLKWS